MSKIEIKYISNVKILLNYESLFVFLSNCVILQTHNSILEMKNVNSNTYITSQQKGHQKSKPFHHPSSESIWKQQQNVSHYLTLINNNFFVFSQITYHIDSMQLFYKFGFPWHTLIINLKHKSIISKLIHGELFSKTLNHLVKYGLDYGNQA